MKLRIFLILTSVVLFSCDNQNETETLTSSKTAASPETIVKNFYHWYLDNYYINNGHIITPIEKIENEKLYLDTSKYMGIIRKCGFFSKKYITEQITIFTACSKELSKISLQEYNECGCSPANLVKNCDFMLYYNWLYHQGESTEDIRVLKSKVTADKAIVEIELLEKKGDKEGYFDIHVLLDKEKDEWKISEIKNAL
jgi:hypothetical protein